MHAHSPCTIPSDVAARRAATARRNGALSRGPATAEGKARSGAERAPPRHLRQDFGPRKFGRGRRAGRALRAAFLARWQPLDAVEAHLVEELAFTAWRQVRLRAVEDAVLARAAAGEPGAPGLPSLPTLIRYRGRLDQDAWRASQALLGLRRGREEIAEPMRLRWLAERIDQALAIAAAHPAPPQAVGEAARTNRPRRRQSSRTNAGPVRTNPPNRRLAWRRRHATHLPGR